MRYNISFIGLEKVINMQPFLLDDMNTSVAMVAFVCTLVFHYVVKDMVW